MKKHFIFTLLFAASATMLNAVERVTVTLHNPLAVQRSAAEMVELDVAALHAKLSASSDEESLLVCSENGDTIASQITYDGKLIFLRPQLGGKGKCVVYVSKGTPCAPYKPQVAGRLYPERQKDFSFENDRIGYRIYGPDTQRKGEKLYGYDVFNKRTDRLILDDLYALQCDRQMWSVVGRLRKTGHRSLADDVYNYGYCYHVDHGEGMDCYKVGSTLGAGTNALMMDGKLIYPWCFSNAEVLDNGPLRLTVRLTFAPVNIGGKEITETRLLTIDAGSSMVKARITYSADTKAATVAGIAVHKENANAYIINKEKGYVAYEDLGDPDIYQKKYREKQDPEKGKCFIACLMIGASDCKYMPMEKETSGSLGHLLVVGDSKSEMEYYFGNAWNRNTKVGILSMSDWQNYLDAFAAQLRKPLKVTIK